MMNSKKYIKDHLVKTSERYRGLKFSYRFNGEMLTHIVKVEPLALYENNLEYLEQEFDFVMDFNEKFSPEELVFISSQSLTKLCDNDIEFIIGNISENVVKMRRVNTKRVFVPECFFPSIADDNQDYALAA